MNIYCWIATTYKSSLGRLEVLVHKNCVQEFTQKLAIPLQIYKTINEVWRIAPHWMEWSALHLSKYFFKMKNSITKRCWTCRKSRESNISWGGARTRKILWYQIWQPQSYVCSRGKEEEWELEKEQLNIVYCSEEVRRRVRVWKGRNNIVYIVLKIED